VLVLSRELSAFIDLWKVDSTAYPMREMMQAVGFWKGTCPYTL